MWPFSMVDLDAAVELLLVDRDALEVEETLDDEGNDESRDRHEEPEDDAALLQEIEHIPSKSPQALGTKPAGKETTFSRRRTRGENTYARNQIFT